MNLFDLLAGFTSSKTPGMGDVKQSDIPLNEAPSISAGVSPEAEKFLPMSRDVNTAMAKAGAPVSNSDINDFAENSAKTADLVGGVSGGLKDWKAMSEITPEMVEKYGQEAIDAAKRWRVKPGDSSVNPGARYLRDALYKTRRAANNAIDRADQKYGGTTGGFGNIHEGVDTSLLNTPPQSQPSAAEQILNAIAIQKNAPKK